MRSVYLIILPLLFSSFAFSQWNYVGTKGFTDATGKTILSQKADFTNKKTITFEIKAQGIYLVTINNSKERIAKKVVVE